MRRSGRRQKRRNDSWLMPAHLAMRRVTTGANELVPDLPTNSYEVKVEDEEVLVNL